VFEAEAGSVDCTVLDAEAGAEGLLVREADRLRVEETSAEEVDSAAEEEESVILGLADSEERADSVGEADGACGTEEISETEADPEGEEDSVTGTVSDGEAESVAEGASEEVAGSDGKASPAELDGEGSSDADDSCSEELAIADSDGIEDAVADGDPASHGT
jgi:hypothetical protein